MTRGYELHFAGRTAEERPIAARHVDMEAEASEWLAPAGPAARFETALCLTSIDSAAADGTQYSQTFRSTSPHVLAGADVGRQSVPRY